MYAAGSGGDPNDSWWLDGVEVAADGRFQLYVPREMDAELLVFGAGHAPQRVAIERSASELVDIHVSRGTRITGQLLNRKDQPVAGAVIAMSSNNDSKLVGMAFDAQSASVTDAEGRFTLPPSSGKCQVWASSSASSMEAGRKTINGIVPPPIVPIVINLSAINVPEAAVTLKEAETITLSGTVRSENGDPVPNFEVKGGTGEVGDVVLASVKTGADGKYQMTVPKPLHYAYLMAFGAKNSEGVWLMAYGECPAAAFAGSQFITFKDLAADHQDADWVLKPFQTQPKR